MAAHSFGDQPMQLTTCLKRGAPKSGGKREAAMLSRATLFALIALAGATRQSSAQYPFVPPPVPCLASGPSRPAAEPRRRALGMLRFSYMTRGEGDPVVEGLSERVTARLRAMRPLEIIESPAAGDAPPVNPEELRTYGGALSVRRILTGRTTATDADVQVTVQLYDGVSGSPVWGAQFHGPTSDVLALEIAVARAIATHVFGKPTSAERAALEDRPAGNALAYTHFIRGETFLVASPESPERAMPELEAATRLDPRFARAWSRLAVAYARRALGVDVPASRDSMLARAAAAAGRAIAVDPRAAHGWLAQASVREIRNPRTFKGVIPAYERAIALEPRSADARGRFGHALMLLGHLDAADAELRRAVSIEPTATAAHVDIATMRLYERAYRESCRSLDAALAVDPRRADAYVLRAIVRLRLGDIRNAWVDAETGRRLGNDVGGALASAITDVYARDTAAARARIKPWVDGVTAGRNPTVSGGAYIALGAAMLGDRANALDVLERVRPRGAELWSALRAPGFDALRSDPRFRRLVDASRSSGGA